MDYKEKAQHLAETIAGLGFTTASESAARSALTEAHAAGLAEGEAKNQELDRANHLLSQGMRSEKSAREEAEDKLAALTADATPEAERRCLDAGMIACITKPVEARQLVAWLDAFARDRSPTPKAAEEIAEARAPEPAAIEPQPIDDVALNDLKSLGGDEFVSEIVDQFLADAANVLKSLHVAVADGDVQKFRDEAHALRSCAANVGAQKVYKLCLEWRAIDARELAIEGEIRIRRLEQEFERAREALAMFRRAESGY